MAFLSQNSFSSFPVFCTLAISAIIFGTAIIIVPAVILAIGDPNETLLGLLWNSSTGEYGPHQSFYYWLLLICLGMHMKALMWFTSHAIAKWIAKIIYLWTTIFYLEKCRLWQVFRDEFLQVCFFNCLVPQLNGTGFSFIHHWKKQTYKALFMRTISVFQQLF